MIGLISRVRFPFPGRAGEKWKRRFAEKSFRWNIRDHILALDVACCDWESCPRMPRHVWRCTLGSSVLCKGPKRTSKEDGNQLGGRAPGRGAGPRVQRPNAPEGLSDANVRTVYSIL